MLRRILLALDDSAHSEAALDLAISWAKRYSAELRAVTFLNRARIQRREPVPIGGMAYKVQRDAALLSRAAAGAENATATFRERSLASGLAADVENLSGDSKVQLRTAAQAADIVVVARDAALSPDGTPGEMLRSLVGAGGSTRPVLAVPALTADSGDILVVWNGDAATARSIQTYCLLGLERDTGLVVLPVNQSAERSATIVQDFFSLHGYRSSIAPSTAQSLTAESLEAAAARIAAPLILMGSPDASRLRRLFASPMYRLLERIRRPVFL